MPGHKMKKMGMKKKPNKGMKGKKPMKKKNKKVKKPSYGY